MVVGGGVRNGELTTRTHPPRDSAGPGAARHVRLVLPSIHAFRPCDIAVDPRRGRGPGPAWNGFSGRGFALDQSVFVQAGDEVILAAEAKSRLDKGALFLDARPVDF